MKKFKKKYKRPQRMWSRDRIESEAELVKNFGLKSKDEIWKAQTLLRKYRRLARNLVASGNKKVEEELMKKLVAQGILEDKAELDDVLGLTVENILNRRLQTVVHRLGLANTAKHARQLIVHGHVAIGSRKVPFPGYLVLKDEERMVKIIGEKTKATEAEKAKKPEADATKGNEAVSG